MRCFWSLVIGLGVLFPSTSHSTTNDFLEKFALSKDRSALLKQLQPGTTAHYFYHILHYQNTKQHSKARAMLDKWKKLKRANPHLKHFQDRQTLLQYAKEPNIALDRLAKRLKLKFNHHRKETHPPASIPSTLPTARIDFTRLARHLLKTKEDLSPFTSYAIERLARMKLPKDQHARLLKRLQWPDLKDLPKLLIEHIDDDSHLTFGGLPIHKNLTLAQLNACLKLNPSLLKENTFIEVYIQRLQPNADQSIHTNRKEKLRYIKRLWSFVRTLPQTQNSLKLHVLYNLLTTLRAEGQIDKGLFLQYLKIPRTHPFVNPNYIKRHSEHRADSSVVLHTKTKLDTVGDDTTMIRALLLHLLAKEKNTQDYEEVLHKSTLKELFATSKLLHGIGKPARWIAHLKPRQAKTLKDRVDIDFAHTNKPLYKPHETIQLSLALKNVKKLLVKVYILNTKNIIRHFIEHRSFGKNALLAHNHQRSLDGKPPVSLDHFWLNPNLQLDGLTANSQKTYLYKEAPFHKVSRTFSFPLLRKRGVYLFEFIGGGKSSRAIIQKGRLHEIHRTSSAGTIFKVLDESGRLAPNPSIWLGNHQYKPLKNGQIVIPFSHQSKNVRLLLQSEDVATPAFFDHPTENYTFQAGIYVDREALLKQRSATVLLRPTLQLNEANVSLKLLQRNTLTLHSTDRFGIKTIKKIEGLKFERGKETTYTFNVPDDLRALKFVVETHVKNLSKNKEETLTDEREFQLNKITQTHFLETFHLKHTQKGYLLTLRDRSGRLQPRRLLQLKLQHRGFQEPIEATLQTDRRGRVFLGALKDIHTLIAVSTESPRHFKRTWRLQPDQATLPNQLSALEGTELSIPFMTKTSQLSRVDLALFELRGSALFKDRFDALHFKDGLLMIKGLTAGDYNLVLKTSQRHIKLKITRGRAISGFAFGAHRALKLSPQKPIQIVGMMKTKTSLKIQLANTSKDSRLHLFGTKEQPEYPLFSSIEKDLPTPAVSALPSPLTRTRTGRTIDDEYRYILERKSARIYPGNMLTKPGLLLNPWTLQNTISIGSIGTYIHGGGRYGKKYAGKRRRKMSLKYKIPYAGPAELSPNLDFYENTSVSLFNLRPNSQGLVEIPLKKLGANQQMRAIAVDGLQTVLRHFLLPLKPIRYRELRLFSKTNTNKPISQQKKVSTLLRGQLFRLEDMLTSEFENIDSLKKAYRLMSSLRSDPHFKEFAFVLLWPRLSKKEKREKYEKFASHELHFFLYKKDPRFFKEVIVPYLKHKKDKTFLDRWFLGKGLKQYLKPWAHGQLNIVEKILLGQKVRGQRKRMVRHILELNELLGASQQTFDRQFATALRLGSLDNSTERSRAQVLRDQLFKSDKFQSTRLEGMKRLQDSTPTSGKSGARGPAGGEKEKSGEQSSPPPPPPKISLSKTTQQGSVGGKGRRDKWSNEGDFNLRQRIRQLYRKLDQTKEFAESNYYKVVNQRQNASLVKINGFWADVARHRKGPFLSRHLAQATRNFTEMMFALAMLDLPFTAPRHKVTSKGRRLELAVAGPSIIFYKKLAASLPAKRPSPLLLKQRVLLSSLLNNGRPHPSPPSEEVLRHKQYTCEVVITNPTSTTQIFDLLLQIPQGSVQVGNGKATQSIRVNLGGYRTRRIEVHFTFPVIGTFAHTPAQLSRKGRLLASAKAHPLKVVEKLSKEDKNTWEYISNHGDNRQVFKALNTRNLYKVDLSALAWRLKKDRQLFLQILSLLRRRHLFSPVLWSYGLKHRDLQSTQEFLQHQKRFVRRCGPALKSPLLSINPVTRKFYEHLEHAPVVNARAHRFGRYKAIDNPKVAAQANALWMILSYKARLSQDDLMAITYTLLVQDRVEEARAVFGRVHRAQIATKLQADYFRVYLEFFKDNPNAARNIATQYKNHPIRRWRSLFRQVLSQLDEIEGNTHSKTKAANDRLQRHTTLAKKEKSFEFKANSKFISLKSQNIKKLELRFYQMDLELLFSRSPFAKSGHQRFGVIRPNVMKKVDVPMNGQMKLPIPTKLQNTNVMIEASAGGLHRSQVVYANALDVQIMENAGQLKVSQQETGRALAKVYVKVYARMNNGKVQFYKDGYTDLRGRFDYTSLNSNELDRVRRFALLLVSSKHGTTVKEASPPKQ